MSDKEEKIKAEVLESKENKVENEEINNKKNKENTEKQTQKSANTVTLIDEEEKKSEIEKKQIKNLIKRRKNKTINQT